MNDTVLNSIRPWSKKVLPDKYTENRRNISKRLQKNNLQYFIEHIKKN
jgi:hypothetical protein